MKSIEELKKLVSPSYIPYYQKSLLIKRGNKQYLWDSDGRKYLDFFGGVCTVSVGHCHPYVSLKIF